MTALPEFLHPEHLNRIVGESGHDVTITEARAEPVGTGQMASSFRLRLTFAGDPGPFPGTVVAKTATGPADHRAVASGTYRNEIEFYRRIAPHTQLRIPECHAAWCTDDAHDFVLLLEDLAPRRQGDQLSGCTPDEARIAAMNLAGLHGPLWNADWLTAVLDPVDEEQAAGFDDVFPTMVDLFLDRYGNRLEKATVRLYERMRSVSGSWFAGRPEPRTVVHGDYRLDNLMFSADGTEVVALDWQTMSLGLPARDLAFLLGTGLSIEDRRAAEDEIVTAYHEALLAHGVPDHDRESCFDDYAYGMLQCPLVVTFGSAVAEPTDRGDEMFIAMAERSAAAIEDLGTLDRIA